MLSTDCFDEELCAFCSPSVAQGPPRITRLEDLENVPLLRWDLSQFSWATNTIKWNDWKYWLTVQGAGHIPPGEGVPIHRLQSRPSRGHCRPRFRHWKYSNSERRSRRRTTGQSVLHRRSNRHRLRSRYDRNVIVSIGGQHLCQLDSRRSQGQLDSRPRHVRCHAYMNRWTASFKSNHSPNHAVIFQPIIQSPARFRSL